jgi:starch phosphorylase
MGRALDNALLNLGLKEKYSTGIDKLGFSLEDVLDQERDAALGNGGLGRLAACLLDSSASQELPVWGYGLRYKYGIFQQLISPDGQQLEAPDPWLDNQNAWELPRLDVTYDVRFYGHADRLSDGSGRAVWGGGQEVVAQAYDVPIPGYDTKNTNNLRLWESKPQRGFDLNSFNGGSLLILIMAMTLTHFHNQLATTKRPSSLQTVQPQLPLCCIRMIIQRVRTSFSY